MSLKGTNSTIATKIISMNRAIGYYDHKGLRTLCCLSTLLTIGTIQEKFQRLHWNQIWF